MPLLLLAFIHNIGYEKQEKRTEVRFSVDDVAES